MVDEKYAMGSKIFEVSVLHKTMRSQASKEELERWGPDVLELHMSGLYFGEGNRDDASLKHPRTGGELHGNNIITLYLNKETANAQGIDWNGTSEDANRLNKLLKDKIFIFNQGLEQLVGSER